MCVYKAAHLITDCCLTFKVAFYFCVQKTKSGLFIPEKAQGKVNEATVVAIGTGSRDKVRVCQSEIKYHLTLKRHPVWVVNCKNPSALHLLMASG